MGMSAILRSELAQFEVTRKDLGTAFAGGELWCSFGVALAKRPLQFYAYVRSDHDSHVPPRIVPYRMLAAGLQTNRDF